MCFTIWRHSPDGNLEMLVLEERGKRGVPREKPLRTRMRTNNKLNLHMMLSPEIEPGPHWWEESAFTTVPSLLPKGNGSLKPEAFKCNMTPSNIEKIYIDLTATLQDVSKCCILQKVCYSGTSISQTSI